MINNIKEPLYQKIYNYLKGEIVNEKLLSGSKLPTELELSEAFGVSKITAKRAMDELEINGFITRKRGHGSFVLPLRNDGNVSECKIVSMILPNNDSSGRAIDYIMGATNYLQEEGYYLSIHTTFGNHETERKYLLDLSDNGVKGIIFYPSTRKNFNVLSSLYVKNFPIVLIDKKIESLPLSSVVSDNRGGGFQATSHLIQLGHRRIAYVSYCDLDSLSSVKERFIGYCKALRQHSITLDLEIIYASIVTLESSNRLTQVVNDLLKKKVTAIFAEHDYLALDIARTLSSMGISVPNDISIIGFDNIELLEHLDIKLTTINQDFGQIGKRASQIVLKQIKKEAVDHRDDIVPVQLILRESTGYCNSMNRVNNNIVLIKQDLFYELKCQW